MKKLFITVLLSVMVFGLTVAAAPAETFLRLPVRVLSGDQVVGDLAENAFSLTLGGQRAEIAHVIKMSRTMAQANSPRNFVLAFNIKDYYGQQVANAITYFVENIFKPGDSLLLWTPVKVYVIPTNKDKSSLIEAIKDLVKNDTLDFKKNIVNATASLNEIIKKFKENSAESPDDTYKGMMTATHVFLSNYSRELMDYRNKFVLPNVLKIREIAGLLAEKNGQKWIVNFQEREIVPIYLEYKEVATQIQDFAERVMEKDQPSATRMWKIIELNEKMMIISENTPVKEITAALQSANISYNTILLKSTGERISMGDTVAAGVDDAFKNFSRFTGGTAVVTGDLTEGLDTIRKANDTYYDLVFKVRDQDKDLAVSVDLVNLPGKSKAKAYYKELYTKEEMDKIFTGIEEPGIKITGIDLQDQKLKFSISGYQLTVPGKEDNGLIKVLVNLFDETNAVVYKTEKTLSSKEKTIDFSLDLPEKYKGDFTLSINAVDMLSLKSAQMNQYAKL